MFWPHGATVIINIVNYNTQSFDLLSIVEFIIFNIRR